MYPNPYQPHGAAEAVVAEEPTLDTGFDEITLRRSGARPVTFRGRELANVMSFRVGTPFWYELNIFQTDQGEFVGDVRMFTKAEDEKDVFTVFTGQMFEDVATFFETYDPAKDVRVDIDFDRAGSSLATLTFQALALQARVLEAEQQYHSLVTELFAELDAPSPAV